MDGKAEKMRRKKPLPPGWSVHVSKNYPYRPYYFNSLTGDSVWECPVLNSKKKSGDYVSSNSSSPRKVYSCTSKSPNSPTSKQQASLKKRKVKPSPSGSPQKIQKAGPISFKIHSARSLVQPPSSNSNNVRQHEQKRPTPAPGNAAAVRKILSCGTKTAVVDPIVRKSSPPCGSADEKSQKGSVFSRLDALKLLRNINQFKQQKKKNRKKSKGEGVHSDGTSKLASKKVEKLSSSNRSCDLGNSFTTCISKAIHHSHKPSSSSSKVQLIVPSSSKAAASRTSVNLGESIIADETVEDVEMTDVSEHIPNLDDSIEPMKIDEYFGSEDVLMLTHVVLDTNFLLLHLKFIDNLKDKPFDECGPPVIFIPWVVIQELDKIKRKRSGAAVCGKASEAVRYLYSMFRSRHPRFRGQSSKMAIKDQPCYQSDCNDDKILQCCEQLFEVLPKEKVILLTEDKNLINKAVINDIFAYTMESFQEHIAKSESAKAPAAVTLTEKEADAESAMKMFLDSKTCEIKNLLKDLLEKVVSSEFENVYGKIWTKIIIVRPPRTLMDLLFCIKKHWIAVFSYMFSDDMKVYCEQLHQMLKKTKGFISEKCDVQTMFASAEAICQQVMKTKKQIAEPVLSEINKLKLVCELQFQKNGSDQVESPSSKKANSSPVSSEETTFIVFQHVWEIIDHFTSLILDCCDVLPGSSSEKPQQLRSDIIAFLPRFYRCITELYRCMQHALENVLSDVHVKELHMCLVNFVPSLKADVNPPDTKHFTVESLATFFRDDQKRELLENGFVQLRDFYESLDRCIARNGSLIVRGTNSIL